jgi:colanic acid/amylovoran biosynthesis protein
VRNLLSKKSQALVQFVPDVAFVLDAESPQSEILNHITQHRQNKQVIIGLNVSGLLYNGQYQAEAHFGLNTPYSTLMVRLIETLLEQPNTVLILVPHVFEVKGHFESDPDACEDLYQRMHANYENRLFVVTDTLNHRQVKYVIGQCDFFLGSRMHACIAALSQGIPAVGLAYSGKFHGVFDSVGAADNVIDLRKVDEMALLSAVKSCYQTRETLAQTLQKTVPEVQNKLMHLFQQFKL